MLTERTSLLFKEREGSSRFDETRDRGYVAVG